MYTLHLHYIYIYAFSRRFYPKRLTLRSSYRLFFFTFYQLLLSLGIEPMILALLAPCSTIWATGKLSILIIKGYQNHNWIVWNLWIVNQINSLCTHRFTPLLYAQIHAYSHKCINTKGERMWAQSVAQYGEWFLKQSLCYCHLNGSKNLKSTMKPRFILQLLINPPTDTIQHIQSACVCAASCVKREILQLSLVSLSPSSALLCCQENNQMSI